MLNDRGLALLYVDGKKVGQAKSEFIQNIPSDGLSLGQDASSTVADHPESFPFNGTAADIRLYWGALDFKAIREWAMAH